MFVRERWREKDQNRERKEGVEEIDRVEGVEEIDRVERERVRAREV